MKSILLAMLCTLGVLASCGLSEEQCTKADWGSIGKANGANGRSSEYVKNHVKSCEKHGISVNQSRWEQGRKEGLKYYCTAQNVYNQGRRGSELRNVCPSGDIANLQKANAKGLSYHQYSSEINDLEREQSDLRQQIWELKETPDSPEIASKISWLRSEIWRLDMRINRLERLRRPYAIL